MKAIERLHYLTQDGVPGFNHEAQVKMACDSGIKWIQIRTKVVDEKERKNSSNPKTKKEMNHRTNPSMNS